MAGTLDHVLGAENLIRLIQTVVGGVPSDLLPPGLFSTTIQTEGNTAKYRKILGNRQTAKVIVYGAKAKERAKGQISDQPVVLIHTYEYQHYDVATLRNLQAEDSPLKQRMGEQTVAREVRTFGEYFRNLRLAAVYSALSTGQIHIDEEGNFLPNAFTAFQTIDYGVPAGNQGTLNVDGSGAILDASWATAGTDIIGQILRLKMAAMRLTGLPITHAFYGSAIPGHLAGNTAIDATVIRSPRLNEAKSRSEIADGLLGLNWWPAYGAFFEDHEGTVRNFFGPNQITFTPDVSPTWYDFAEGSYAIPTSLGVVRDASEALATFQDVTGVFSYALISPAPPGIDHYAGDTMLPVLSNPNAIFLATVPIV